MEEIRKKRILKVLHKHIDFSEDEIDFDEDLVGLGMDSMAFVKIVVSLEDEFQCEVPDEKLLIPEMNTINKILNVLALCVLND